MSTTPARLLPTLMSWYSLVLAAKDAALVVGKNVPVLPDAVLQLDLALVEGDGEGVAEEEALGDIGSLGVGSTSAAVVVSLAALGVDILALSVLLLASFVASAGEAALAEPLTAARVGLGVELELVAGLEILKDIVAGDDGDLNATNGVSGSVVEEPAGRLLADTGRRRRDDGDRGSGGSRGRRARVGGNGGGSGLPSLGLLLLVAVPLAARALLARAAVGAVARNILAPSLEFVAAGTAGEAGTLETGVNLESTSVAGLGAAVLVLEVREVLVAPLTAAVLASSGGYDSGGAHGRGSGARSGLGGVGRRGRKQRGDGEGDRNGNGNGNRRRDDRRKEAARLKRQQLLRSVDLNSSSATALLVAVSVARHTALVAGGGRGVVTNDDTAVALGTEFETSKRVTVGGAGSDTGRGGHLAAVNLVLTLADGTSVVGVVGVAADGLEGVDIDLGHVGEGRIGPDRESTRTTAGLVLGSLALEATGRLVKQGAVDSRTAVADTVEGETSVAVTVALALRNTLGRGHGVLISAGAVVQGILALSTLLSEATRVGKGLERVKARGQLDISRSDLSKEGSSCKSSYGSNEGSHFKRMFGVWLKKEWTGLLRKQKKRM